MEQLLSSGYYKEHYRLDMIKWSDEIREADPEYFCRLAVKSSKKISSRNQKIQKLVQF